MESSFFSSSTLLFRIFQNCKIGPKRNWITLGRMCSVADVPVRNKCSQCKEIVISIGKSQMGLGLH